MSETTNPFYCRQNALSSDIRAHAEKTLVRPLSFPFFMKVLSPAETDVPTVIGIQSEHKVLKVGVPELRRVP